MIFKRVVPDEYYLVAMAADDVTNLNFGFKRFAAAVGIYAAINP